MPTEVYFLIIQKNSTEQNNTSAGIKLNNTEFYVGKKEKCHKIDDNIKMEKYKQKIFEKFNTNKRQNRAHKVLVTGQ